MTQYKSVFTNEQELLSALLILHNGGNPIELDPMYNRGGFYKGAVQKPRLIFDLKPRVSDCPQGNAESLPLKSGSIGCMTLDPLFMFGIHGKTEQRYASVKMGILPDFIELERHYKAILREAWRVLKQNGVLIFKCQDYTDGKTTMTHAMVYNWAVVQGFYAKDIAILVRENKIYNPKVNQRHLRKAHTYFWVFVKVRAKNVDNIR
jgi:hypothetical protein